MHKAPKKWGFPILTLKYEDLVNEPVEVLRKILNFAGLETNEAKLKCASVVPCKKEKACRARDKSKEADPYTDELKAKMLPEFEDVMKELGYSE